MNGMLSWYDQPNPDPDSDWTLHAWETQCGRHGGFDRIDPDHPDHHEYVQWTVWWQLNELAESIRVDRQIAAWAAAEQEHHLGEARRHGNTYTNWCARHRLDPDSGDTAEHFLYNAIYA